MMLTVMVALATSAHWLLEPLVYGFWAWGPPGRHVPEREVLGLGLTT